MFAKNALRILTLGTLVAAATPAFADPPRWAPAHGYRAQERAAVTHQYYRQPAVREVIVKRPVVRKTVIVERPMYVQRHARYAPPRYRAPVHAVPVRAGRAHDATLGTVGGAVIGAVIGSQVGTPEHRPLATAVGAVIGAVVGSNF
jgi:uncharacterized protein YcfJ